MWAALALIALWARAASCQYYFGQNKIQPFGYRWDVLQTEHFDVYYFSCEREIALVAADIAEKAYQSYTAHFRFAPDERVPIVLYSSPVLFSETHTTPYIVPEGISGFTELVKGRVVLPFDGSIARFRHVLSHELVHVWQMHYNEFLHDAHELFFLSFPPLWFVEGEAEFLSQPREPVEERTELVRALANDELVLPHEFAAISGTYQMYKESASFLRFLSLRYGSDVDVRLFERVWEHAWWDDVFRAVVGTSVEEAGLAWRQWLWTRFGRYAASRKPYELEGKRISPEGFFFSPYRVDSAAVLCKGNVLGYGGLFLISRGRAKLLRKVELTQATEAVRLVGNRIGVLGDSLVAFSAKSKGREKLFVLNIRSGECQDFGFDSLVAISSPSFSPDGRRIILSAANLAGFTDIWSLDVATGDITRVTNDHFYDAFPVQLATGEIAFVSDRGDPDSLGIFLLGEDCLRRVVWDGCRLFRPRSLVQSDCGRWLLFIADDDTFPDAYALDLQGDGVWRLTHVNAPVMDVGFWGGDFAPGSSAPSPGTLLVSVEGKDGIEIRVVAPETVEFVGTYRLEPFVGGWSLPTAAQKLASGAPRQKPNAHKLSFDLAQGGVSTASAQEVGGGLEVMLSDMVGDRRLYVFFAENARSWEDILSDANLFVAYSLYGNRFSLTAGGFHLHFRSYDRYEGSYDERQAGALVGASYALSRFLRAEAVTYLYYSRRSEPASSRVDGIASANASIVWDNSLWGITGPIDGARANLTVGAGVGLSGKLYHYLASIDLRHYLRLGRRVCWAHRLIVRHSAGEEPQRFYMGGTWDMRGYPYFSFFGRNQLLLNSELRFPLLDRLLVRTPLLDIDLRGIRGALFFDAGDAWEDEPHIVGSYGVGARMNLEGYVVLRFDLAQTTDFRSVDPHWRWDIFFGWDF